MKRPRSSDLNPPTYHYPEHLFAAIAEAKAVPGVYLFWGSSSEMPLYIGKSVNLRARLLAHLRNRSEVKLLSQTQRIEWRECAGEIAALLLESSLIKSYFPLLNKRLRKSRRLCTLRWHEEQLQVVSSTALPKTGQLFGLFRHARAAQQYLRTLADQQQLCLRALGLESPSPGPCFRAQLGKCRGYCAGHESLNEHNLRLLQALEQIRIQQWPFSGPVALYEQHGRLRAYHVLNQWHYLGSFASKISAQRAARQAVQDFDADSYKILVKPLLEGRCKIIALD